jgi:integrase
MKGQFKVNKTNQHPDRPYCVDGNVNGVRRRFYFRTREEADEKVRLENFQLHNFGHAAANISASLRLDALVCQSKLEGTGRSLTQAVDEFLKNFRNRTSSVTVAQACEEYLAHTRSRVESDEIGDRQFEGVAKACSRFAETFGSDEICDMTSDRIRTWLTALKKRDGNPMGLVSRNSFKLGLSGLFSYALARKWISAHPIAGGAVPAFRTKRAQAKRPEILSLEQTAKLLEAADSQYLPAIAIGLFAGLRPAEVRRLCWENIHWQKKEIDVLASSSKTASYRYVPMPENLVEWLAPYRGSSGKLYNCTAGTLARKLSAIGKLVGLNVWPKDALRHSYGSHLYAATENAHVTARRMGHMTTEMLHSNYNNRRTKAEGEAYFEIRPSAQAQTKVVAIAA